MSFICRLIIGLHVTYAYVHANRDIDVHYDCIELVRLRLSRLHDCTLLEGYRPDFSSVTSDVLSKFRSSIAS